MGTLVAAKTGGAVAIPGNVTLERDGRRQRTPPCNSTATTSSPPPARMTFNTPLASARLELNGHATTLSAINGDSHAVIEGLFDNTGLNGDSTLDGQQRRRLHVRRSDPQQLPGQRHGQGEPD